MHFPLSIIPISCFAKITAFAADFMLFEKKHRPIVIRKEYHFKSYGKKYMHSKRKLFTREKAYIIEKKTYALEKKPLQAKISHTQKKLRIHSKKSLGI